MPSFHEVLQDPQQKIGELWQKAHTTLEDTPPELLERITIGEDTYLATPLTRPLNHKHIKIKDKDSEEEKTLKENQIKIYSNNFRIAQRVNHQDDRPNDTSPIYLIANDNFRTPALSFSEHASELLIVGQSVGENVSDSSKYLPDILDSIKLNISEQIRLREQQASSDRRKAIGASVSVLVLAGVITSAIAGVAWWRNDKDAEAERERLLRKSFDELNITIDGESTEAGDLDFIAPSLAFFAQEIPEPTDNDTFSSPQMHLHVHPLHHELNVVYRHNLPLP